MTGSITEDSYVLYLVGFSSVATQSDRAMQIAESLTLEETNIGSIRCWFRYIEADLFQGPEAEANLADLEWLTPRVLMHETAVSSIAERVPLCPTRFGTLFSSLASLNESVTRWEEDLNAFFQRVAGRREWGLKIFMDRKPFEHRLLAKLVDGDPTNVRGAGYLRLKRERQKLGATCQTVVDELVEWTESEADSLELECVRRGISTVANEDDDWELVGNLAVLTDSLGLETLRLHVENYYAGWEHACCFKVETTGPWAAYSFCPSLT